MNRILLFIFLIIFNLLANAQNTIGLPEIVNYSKQLYKGGAQTRQAAQDKNGIMYFANDEGVLSFNGARWNIFPLPNKSLVRCLELGPDNKLYAGGQDEFGYFSPLPNGHLEFHSLKDILPQDLRSFADVWEICLTKNSIFFQTTSRIYQITGNQLSVYDDPHWLFMGTVGEKLIAQSASKGLMEYINNSWTPLVSTNGSLPVECITTSITSIGRDSAILTTLKHGIYLINQGTIRKMTSPLLSRLEGKNISSSKMVNSEQIAIGTNLDGCFIIDKKGNLVRSFGRVEGLQDNSILGIFLDSQNNLWLGLHNGIDFISYNNAVKHIHTNFINEGAGYSSHIFKNELYIGTSIGVFKVPLQGEKDLSNIKAQFIPIKNTEGEAWNLSEVNNQLLVGHNDGALLVKGNSITNLDKKTGYWNFQPYYNVLPTSVMVAGTYNSINFYGYTNNIFSTTYYIVPTESARFVVINNNRVWFSHPYKGVYSLQLKDSVPQIKKYSSAEGIASNNNNYLFKIKNGLLLTTETGVFEYHEVNDRFIPSEFYNKHLPKSPIRYLKEDTEGNVWFVFEKKIGVLDLTASKPQIIYFPELNNKFVAGFEHINPINKNNILIGGEKGFYHINYEQYKLLANPLTVKITAVRTINEKDSLLFGGFANINNQTPLLPHQFNSLHFEFASAMYGQLSNLEYSYYLQGFDADWIAFNKRTEKDYTNLPPGDYVFKVKARNNLGNESAVSEYSFTVLPPWYGTIIAYILYILAAAIFFIWLYQLQKKKLIAQQLRHEEEQKRLQYLHQLELDKAENEITLLRNQKLEAEIMDKTSELATTTMHLVQKTDVLLSIKEQMMKIKKQSASGANNSPDLKKILTTLNDENRMEEKWHQFSIHFDAVHNNFLAGLKKNYPVLTPNDHKLCAYLKMNLTTKEIAQLMNISIRGVEISRYRLRKKLNVPNGMNLFSFINTVS